jgi:alkaline phosphatase
MGDRMKEVNAASRVVAIAGKDRSAVLMGGHRPDLALWWDGKVFSTYKDSPARMPSALPRINAAVTDEIAHPALLPVPALCKGREESISINDKLTVGTLLPRKAGEGTAWRSTPLLDTKTMDLVLATVDEMQLGKGRGPDLLAISLSATDYVGHAFGTSGVEMCAQILALDATLERLFSALDKAGISYVTVLTADHGGHDVVERNVRRGFAQIERVDSALLPDKMGPRIAQQLGLDGTALLSETASGDVYVNGLVPPARRGEVLAAAFDAYKVHRQVAAVFTHAQLLAAPEPGPNIDEWTLLERAKASFDPARSGDLVVMLKENVSSIPPNIANTIAGHGSPWNRDRRVPILFWWKGIQPFEQPNSVETVDILPTLASLIDLAVPAEEIDGRCLDLLPSGETNCPAPGR